MRIRCASDERRERRHPPSRPSRHAAAAAVAVAVAVPVPVPVPVPVSLLGLILLALPFALGAGCSSSASTASDGGSDAVDDAGTPVCPAPEAGTPAGVADDFGPNAKLVATPSALGQLNVYEIVAPRQLEWVDLYLRAGLGGTRVTIAVYEALARNAVFSKLTDVQLDVPSCAGWIGSGPLGIPLQAGRFYAVGFDPNQAISDFVDSESNDLPIDGELGRLIGSKTSTSVSLDTLDWGTLATNSFTRQRLFTSPGDGDGDGAVGASDADAEGADAGPDLGR